MKTFRNLSFLFLLMLFLHVEGYSQIPAYTLEAKNFALHNPFKITFDIVVTHTDANFYEVSGWQYIFKVPQALGDIGVGSGTNSGYQYDSSGGTHISDLPAFYIPRNPSVAAMTINGIPFYELRLAANAIPSQGNGLILQQNVPVLIIRMKIKSNTPFNVSSLNILFRDSCTDNPVSITRTKMYAIVGTSNLEITRCVNHSVDVSGMFLPPVSCEIRLAPEGFYNPVLNKLNRNETVNAYLRRVTSPYQIIDSAAAVIDSNILTGNFIFSPSTAAGQYYIVVKHRNSVETWSKTGGENLIRGHNNYDFIPSASQAYGDNMVQKGNIYCIYSGNVNGDSIIDIEDLLLIDNDLFNFVNGNVATDLNGDNAVDIEDMSIADDNAANLIAVERP